MNRVACSPSFVGYSLFKLILLFAITCRLTGQGDIQAIELGPPLIVPEPPGMEKMPAEPLRDAYSSSTWFDTSSRSAVKTAYDSIFTPTTPIAVNWTGSVSGHTPGTTSTTYKDAVLTRINWFRAMAGVPANIALDTTFTSKSQKAALLMSSNNQINHYPPSGWLNWTADGYEAAGKSNLCGGTSYPSEMLSNDPGCIQGYMDDDGSNNTAVGHRRWLLVPQTRFMGTGDVTQTPIGSPSPSYMSANAVWVQDGHYSDARPTTRDTFVAWPPKGYVPYQVVPRRWSFSYGSASFGGATITMSVNGSPVSLTKLTVQPSSGYIGENTVAWEPATDFTQQPSTDTTVNVTISGISGYPGGSTVSYAVTIFNPAQGATLEAPVLLSPSNGATGVSTSGLSLTWNAAAGATSYDVHAGSSNPPPYISNTTATSVSLSSVSSGVVYYWKIVARNSSTTASSSVWSFTTAGGGPSAPTLSSPANGATGVATSSTLQWNSAAGATSYDVYLGTSNPPNYLTNASATAYAPTLSSGVTYYWKIAARNGSGTASSAVWSFTTASSMPSAPNLVSPSNGATGVAAGTSLTWSTASGATSYDVYFGTSNPPSYVTNTGALSYAPSLSAGSTYYWKVVARNGAGTASSAVWSFTAASGAPGSFSLLSPANGATGVPLVDVDLDWTASSGATSYDVYVSRSNPPAFAGTVTGSGATLTSTLLAASTYYWKVVAKNASSTTSSPVWSFTTAGTAGPGAFSLLAPANGATGIARSGLQLAWTSSTGATSYDVYIGSSSPPAYSGTVTGTTATLTTALTANRTYYWQIVANNAGGERPSSIWSFTTAGAAPGSCSLLSPFNGATNVSVTGLQLAWSIATDASSYDIYFGTSNPPPMLGNVTGTSTPVAMTLNAGTTYYWSVTARNSSGTSPSAVWSFVTAAPSGPPAPTLAYPVPNATGVPIAVALAWMASTGATSYDVYFGTSNPPPLVSTTAALSYTPPPLSYATVYYWRVAARSGTGTNSSGVSGFTTATNANTTAGLRFVPITPCRLVDTRPAYAGTRSGAFGPPLLAAATTRVIPIPQSQTCTVPANAKAYVLNLTLDTFENQTGPVDFVTLWPAGEARPDFYTARTSTGGYIANAAIVRAGEGGAISAYSSSGVNLILDINGYFTDDPSAPGLLYYPISPCRAVDTRGPIYSSLPPPYGNQRMQARENRTFPLTGSPACQIPTASAYSAQLTLAPGELTNGDPVAFITAYPTGVAQPGISNMNALFGYAVANSAIIPAGPNGGIDVFAYNATNLIIDVNGYFAPDDGTGRGLYYYPVTQCRLMNTQDPSFSGPFGGPALNPAADRTIPVPYGRCGGLPNSAKAWALNASVVPNGQGMPYLSMWPTGTPFPNVSQLNAFQGQTLANSGIVPAAANGSIEIKVAATTHVTLDVAGYFSR